MREDGGLTEVLAGGDGQGGIDCAQGSVGGAKRVIE